MRDTERRGLCRILWLKRVGAWLPIVGLAVGVVAALGYSEHAMLGVAVVIFLIAGVLNTLYMFSRCPRCRRFFNSIPESRFAFIWPVGRCRHCGLHLTDEKDRNRVTRSEEHTSELQSRRDLVCRLLLEKKKKYTDNNRLRT